MRSLLVLIKHNLNLMIWKSKSKFLISIIIPIAIIFLISKLMLGGSSGIKVGVVNEDNSKASNYIVSTISNGGDIDVINLTQAQLKGDFAQNTISSALVIKDGFENDLLNGKNDGIKIIGRDGDESYKLVQAVVNSNITNIDKLAIASNGNKAEFNSMLKKYESNNINVSLKNESDLKTQLGVSQLFVGFLIVFILGRAMSGAERIMEDRKNGVFERLLLTDTSIFKYYLGNILASIISISIQILASLLLVKTIININFGMSIFDMCIILILTALFAVSLGTLFVSISRNSEEAGMLSSILVMGLVMLGGCFIPVSIFPSFINKISNLLPTRWIMNMVSNIQTGSTLIGQFGNIILLVLVSVVIMLFAAFITKNKDKR